MVDDWGVCPNCVATKEDELTKVYGTVPLEEFLKMSEELSILQDGDEAPESLRQDYSFRLEDGSSILHIVYVANCSDCGLNFKFKRDVNIRTGEEIEVKE